MEHASSEFLAIIQKSLGERLEEIDLESITTMPSLGYTLDDYGRIVGLALDIKDAFSATSPHVRERVREELVAVSQLRQLQRLSLAYLGTPDIPEWITEMEDLERLQLYGNRIAEIPRGLTSLQKLRYLGLGNNDIRQLSRDVLDLELGFSMDANTTEDGICLWGNPLEHPPLEIVAKGRNAVLRYFGSAADSVRVLSEVKILFVGDGGSGKTSLVNRLRNRKFRDNEPQTHGINIDDWVLRAQSGPVKAHLWDFGGQEIMHATHQFFLSERSLYVLVLDGRKEEDAEYWLKHIETFGGDSPILLVLNKIDENPSFDLNRRFLESKYRGILGFFPLSCKTKRGLKPFAEALAGAVSQVDIIKTAWPEAWFQMKSRLESMDKDFISYEEYVEACKEEGVDENADQDTLVGFLHDLGTVVHFPELDLRDTHVLEPRWLTGAVYQIINSDLLAQKKGILKIASLPNVLAGGEGEFRYPVSKHPYILSLMEKFEICYHIDRGTILVPDLLQVQEPEIDFDFDEATQLRIEYDFLPKSVMPRFIVKKHADIKGDLRWRTGVVLHRPEFESTAVVRTDQSAKRITIYVSGSRPHDYLTVLRATFLEINRSYHKLRYTERLPLPDEPEATVSYGHLLQLEREGIRECYPEGATHPYDVRDLLGTVCPQPAPDAEEFAEILRQVLRESDSRQSMMAKAKDIIALQPNFMGIGININAALDAIVRRRKSSPKRKGKSAPSSPSK
ncbi:COR domain-containing protein [Planctomycetota bacterium]